jgi:hypothetical protein
MSSGGILLILYSILNNESPLSGFMNTKIERKLDKIDAKLQDLLTDLQQYSDSSLNYKPDDHTWSALQVMHHLLTSERLSTKYIKKKLSYNPDLPDVNFGTQWRAFLLRSYNYLPVKLKAPKNVSESLPEKSSLAETSEAWLATRQELRAFLNTLPEETFKKEVYKHPVSGRLSLFHMLDFFDRHFDRHLKQINRTLDAIK